jgi:hypothetical protein
MSNTLYFISIFLLVAVSSVAGFVLILLKRKADIKAQKIKPLTEEEIPIKAEDLKSKEKAEIVKLPGETEKIKKSSESKDTDPNHTK